MLNKLVNLKQNFPRIFKGKKTEVVDEESQVVQAELGASLHWTKKFKDKPEKARNLDTFKIKKFFILSLVFVDLTLFVSYLIGINTYASSGYKIRKIEKEILAVSEVQKKLNAKISETTSLISVQSSLTEYNFVPVKDPIYFEKPHLSSR